MSECNCPKRNAENPGCPVLKCPEPSERNCGGCEVLFNRKGSFIECYSGVHFWPLDARPDEVKIEDIAHALSQICRFNGHTRFMWSVASHSLACMELAFALGWSERIQLLALMHDAAEAYICDLARPVKGFIAGYKSLEIRLQETILKGLGMPLFCQQEINRVKELDNIMLVTEGFHLMPFQGWGSEYEPTNLVQIAERPMIEVEQEFLLNYARLKEMITCPSSLMN